MPMYPSVICKRHAFLSMTCFVASMILSFYSKINHFIDRNPIDSNPLSWKPVPKVSVYTSLNTNFAY